MTLLLNWRVWLAAILLGTFAFSNFVSYRKGKANEHAAWVASVAEQNAESLRLERARQSSADAAARDSAAREARILADAASARRDASGLRDILSGAVEYAKKSRAAAERTASLTTGLLDECSRALIDVSEAADRADSEARELRAAWPK